VLGAVIRYNSKLRRALLKELKDTGTAERAAKQQAYMKSELPFAGVAAPELKSIAKSLFVAHPLATQSAWQNEVLSLFRDPPFRELRYTAMALAFHTPYRAWLTAETWDMLDELVVTGSWWDIIDALAPNHYAHLLISEPKISKPRLRQYAGDANLWRRRVAILCQLKTKADTDERLLFGSVKKSLTHKDFFVRKAIGWALRAHSRTNPIGVLEFIELHAENLSPLSKREALKLLKKHPAYQNRAASII